MPPVFHPHLQLHALSPLPPLPPSPEKSAPPSPLPVSVKVTLFGAINPADPLPKRHRTTTENLRTIQKLLKDLTDQRVSRTNELGITEYQIEHERDILHAHDDAYSGYATGGESNGSGGSQAVSLSSDDGGEAAAARTVILHKLRMLQKWRAWLIEDLEKVAREFGKLGGVEKELKSDLLALGKEAEGN